MSGPVGVVHLLRSGLCFTPFPPSIGCNLCPFLRVEETGVRPLPRGCEARGVAG